MSAKEGTMAEPDYVMNDGGEYGNYILQDLRLPAVHAAPEAVERYERAGRRRVHWLDGRVMPSAFQINTAWYYEANHEYMDRWAEEEGEAGTIGKPHVHAVDELLCFYGSDPENPYDLNGEVEIWIEGERHLLTKSSLIYLPAGVSHLPLYVNRVERPIFHFSPLLDAEYAFACENGEVFEAR